MRSARSTAPGAPPNAPVAAAAPETRASAAIPVRPAFAVAFAPALERRSGFFLDRDRSALAVVLAITESPTHPVPPSSIRLDHPHRVVAPRTQETTGVPLCEKRHELSDPRVAEPLECATDSDRRFGFPAPRLMHEARADR